MDDLLASRVDALKRAGRFEEAARILLDEGDPRSASELVAAVWQYARAIELAEDAELFDLAYRHALDGEDVAARDRALVALRERPEQAVVAAAHAEMKGRVLDAARLREAAGEVELAAQLFERAGELFEAARLREASGRYREAGLLYERRVRDVVNDGEAALRLGRILAHFGRYDHAVRALQIAEKDSERRGAARPLMIACLAALGLDDAAAARLDDHRTSDPLLPMTVPEYLVEAFGDERGLAGLTQDKHEERLLAGRYRITRPLGAGATGRVLLAHDGFYERDVAVKVLTVGAGAAGRDAYTRFAREARVAAGLEHPNVVRVFEYNAEGPFIVMEYMPGGTLEDRFEERGGHALPLTVVRHVMLSVLEGLEAVHRRGVVHRDLKPANVFFGAAGDVKIGDFGVAHLTDLGATLTGALLGTLAYMAPEQITGASQPRAATDIYSLGVILYRMLTGKLPFPGPDFLTQHLETIPPPPSATTAALAPLDDLISAMLHKDPDTRLPFAADVRRAVEAADWEMLAPVGPLPERESVPVMRESEGPPDPQARFSTLESLADGASLARDELLVRLVRIEPCDDARAARLKALAKVDCPYLQAIYEVDPERNRAVVERPAGALLSEMELEPERRMAALREVRAALDHMHSLGVVHGAVAPDRIRVAAGRAVLLLPPGVDGQGSTEDDLAALARC